MHAASRRFLIVLALILATTAVSVLGQVVTATLPVGNYPERAAVNTSTNKIYVANALCNSTPCSTPGTVTVIDGATNNTIGTVTVGISPYAIAVNSTTNKIYVGNICGNDSTCQSPGTVTVIDGSTLATATVAVGYVPIAMAVNPVTNQIYVTNECLGPGYPSSCTVCETGQAGTITAINGSTLQTQAIPVGCSPYGIAVNTQTNTIYAATPSNLTGTTGTVAVVNGTTLSVQNVSTGWLTFGVAVDAATNQIYATNLCGNDPDCQSAGTVTVIDGATLNTQSATVGYNPLQVAVNPVTNNIYVNNRCGGPGYTTQPSMTVINGTTLATTTVPVCTAAGDMAADLEVNTVTNKIYLPCASNLPAAHIVTLVDGVTNTTMPIAVGDEPGATAVNSVTNNIYVPNFADTTVSVIGGATKAQLNTVTPCRLVDTRPSSGGSGPISGGSFEAFNLPQLAQQKCPGLNLSSAISYSLNVTLVPSNGPVGYLTIWPDSQIQPVVSTMNSDGRIKANAAIVSAGLNGAVDVYVANTANIILDIDAYFGPSGSSTLQYYPLTPCRIADTRQTNFPQGLGAPSLVAQQQRSFPLLNATTCFQQVPPGVTVAAYSLNFTAVPDGTLGYLTIWPTGQPIPNVSTLNAPTGTVAANAAIVPAGTGGAIDAYAYNNTDLIIDIDGYFAAPGTGGLSAYPTAPCRILDTRKSSGGNGPFTGTLNPPVNVLASPCALPSSVPPASLGYIFNATVVPYQGRSLGYLTLWPVGENLPVASTLNAYDGAVTSNMAIVPAGTNGEINAYAGFGTTDLILDISSFFAP